MTNYNDGFLSPDTLRALYAAVDEATRCLSSNGVRIDERDPTREVLAAGVLRAASRGERNVIHLATAGCEHWLYVLGVARNISKARSN